MDALSVTEAGMRNDVERLRVISHNLANVTTAGFKRELAVTRPFLEQLDPLTRQAPTGLSGQTTRPSLSVHTDHSGGALKLTASPLDVALEGPGFFAVSASWGEAYTRQGTFRLDADGRLLTQGGLPVLGESGEVRLTIPNPRIDQDGYIWEGEVRVGRLKLVDVRDLATLERIGDGLFAASAETQFVDAGTTRVRQAYAETANVTSMTEMVRMIETMRHFETSQRVLRSYDDMLDRSINLLGEL